MPQPGRLAQLSRRGPLALIVLLSILVAGLWLVSCWLRGPIAAADGTGLALHDQFVGGHPEWDEGNVIIGSKGDRQVRYDIEKKKIIGQIGTPEMFPKPGGDISLSPGGDWFANGYGKGDKNYYAIYRRSDGAFVRSEGIDKGGYSGDIRIDPAPRWNRTNDAILVPGLAENGTRQMFILHVITGGE